MSDRSRLDNAGTGGNELTSRRSGPGRWLLTLAGVFTMVIVLAVIFAFTILVFAT